MGNNKHVFNALVDTLKAAYPKELEGYSIFDTSTFKGRWQLKRHFKNVSDLDWRARRELSQHSGICRPSFKSIAVNEKESRKDAMIGDAEKDLLFILAHEAGHAIMGHTEGHLEKTDDWARKEPQADIFGVLACLKEGLININDVRNLTRFRLDKEMRGSNATHLTAKALNAFIQKYEHADFSAMSWTKIKAIAIVYGEKFKPAKKEIAQAQEKETARAQFMQTMT